MQLGAVGADDYGVQTHVAGVRLRERTEWKRASTAEEGHQPAFGVELGAACRMVERPEPVARLLVLGSRLHREGSLSRRGHHLLDGEGRGELRLQPEASQSGDREDERVDLRGLELGETRVDVPAEIHDGRAGAASRELRGTPDARGPD